MDRIAQIQLFLKESPQDCFLKHALALEFVKIGEDEKASLLFEENLQFNPDYLATYYHLGKLMEKMEQPEKAVILYEEGMAHAKAAKDMHTFNELQNAFEGLSEG